MRVQQRRTDWANRDCAVHAWQGTPCARIFHPVRKESSSQCLPCDDPLSRPSTSAARRGTECPQPSRWPPPAPRKTCRSKARGCPTSPGPWPAACHLLVPRITFFFPKTLISFPHESQPLHCSLAKSSILVNGSLKSPSIRSLTSSGFLECSLGGENTVCTIPSLASGSGLPLACLEPRITNSVKGLTTDGRTPLAPNGSPDRLVLTQTKPTPR